MRKRFFFMLFILVLTSCSQELVFNNDASFQGVKNNIFWKAGDATATKGTANSLNIEAFTIDEILTLKVPFPSKFVNQNDPSTYLPYVLGKNETSKATYSFTSNAIVTSFQTGFGKGDGEIVITNYDGATVSGTYRFNALNTNLTDEVLTTVNFQKGFFYRVPIVTE